MTFGSELSFLISTLTVNPLPAAASEFKILLLVFVVVIVLVVRPRLLIFVLYHSVMVLGLSLLVNSNSFAVDDLTVEPGYLKAFRSEFEVVEAEGLDEVIGFSVALGVEETLGVGVG